MATPNLAKTDTTTATQQYFRPRRLGHVNLIVSDTDQSMTFYNTVIGLDEAYRVEAIKGGFLSNGNTHHDIGMIQSSGASGRGRPPGLNHLAFELETEVDLVNGYERALGDNLVFDRTLDHDIAHSAYCSDPDGNSCEIYADVVRDWRNARNGIVTKPKPVWRPGLTVPNTERNYDPAPDLQRVESAIFHPLRVKHAALVVKEFERAIDFYTQNVGLNLLVGNSHDAFAILGGTCGERNITLLRAGYNQPAGLHHIGLELRDDADLDASIARLRTAGSDIELHIEHPLRRAVYVKDPDGHRLQLFLDREHSMSMWAGLDFELATLLA
jgi:catechol 2,3-dioxygenase